MNKVLADVDSLIATLVEGLKQRLNNCFNLVILSDHGTIISELSVGWVDPRVGLGWVGNGSKICVFSGLGWVIGLKWQMCEKYMSYIYVTLCRVSTGKFVL